MPRRQDLEDLLLDKADEFLTRVIDRLVPPPKTAFVSDEAPRETATDPYRVLGLRPTATAADVKARVRELARIYHPDLDGGDADKMAEVNRAAAEIVARLRAGRC